MKKRILSALLAIIMIVGLIPATVSAAEESTGEAIELDTGSITGYDAEIGYHYIYYGTYNNEPIKWRVLDDQTNMGTNGLFVLSENVCDGNVQFDTQESNSRVYQDSKAQAWCNTFYNGSFTETEKRMILSTTKSDEAYTCLTNIGPYGNTQLAASENILKDDKVFFLSAEEADKAAYGFTDASARIAYLDAVDSGWWFRSPSTSAPNNVGHAIAETGEVYFRGVSRSSGARPAFNLNTTNVVFVEPASAGATNEWKLNLLDSSRNFAVTETALNGFPGGTVSVNYTGAVSGTNEYISTILTDESGDILYSGTIATVSESGKAEFSIPADLAVGDYTLKLFNEQANGDKMTDIVSNFDEVALTVEEARFTVSGQVTPAKENVLVYLYTKPNYSPSWNTKTDANGNFAFTDIPNGMYEVQITKFNLNGTTYENAASSNFLVEGTNVTITPGVKATEFTVTFNTNGHGTAPDNVIVKKSTPYVTEPAEPTAEGWYFLGWFTDADCINAYNFTSQVTDSFTLYAKWSNIPPVTYSATLTTASLTGATAVLSKTEDIGVNDTVTITITPESGKAFYIAPIVTVAGATAGNVVVTMDGTYTCEITDFTDTAIITVTGAVDTYPITYETNGGTFDGNYPTTYTKGVGVELPKNITKEDHTFAGWYIYDGTGPFGSIGDQATGHMTYYAKWKENVAIPAADETVFIYTGTEQTYTIPENAAYTISGNIQTNATEYTVTVSLKNKDTHCWTDGTTNDLTFNFVIAKATYDMSGVTFADASYPFDGAEKELVISGTLPEGVTVSYENNKLTDVGSVEATAKFSSDNPNYNAIEPKTATLTITNATFSVTASGYDGVYDGKTHTISVTADGATITYSTDGTSYSATKPEFTDAGTYPVYYKAVKANHSDVTGFATVKIAKATPVLTITPSDTSLWGGGRVTFKVMGAPAEGDYTITSNPAIRANKDGSFTLRPRKILCKA